MKKRIVRTGLVGNLKDDFAGAGNAFETNLKRRMRMLCSRPGPRYDPEAKLELTMTEAVAGTWRFRLEDVGVVIYDDYDFWCPETLETLEHLITLPPQGLHYVILRKLVTDSEIGVFMPGYPEDGDAFTEQNVSVELDVVQEYERGPHAIPIYCVSFDGVSFTIEEDYRSDVCLILNSDIALTESDMEIQSISAVAKDVADLQQELEPESQGSGIAISSFNLQSHPRNSLRKGSYLDISWPTIERDLIVWAYHVRVTPYAGTSPDVNKAFHTMVLGQPGQYTASYQHPIVRGQRYQVSVRALSSSLARIIGPWKDISAGQYSEIMSALPKPTTPVLAEYGINPRTYLWSPIEDQPVDLESVCFKRVWQDHEEIVYEGGYRPVILEAAPISNSTFYMRYKYKNSTYSPWSDPVTVIGTSGGVSGSASSQHLSLVIPVDALMTRKMSDAGNTIGRVATIKIPRNSPNSSIVGKIVEARMQMLGLGNVGDIRAEVQNMELKLQQNGISHSLMRWELVPESDAFDMPIFGTSAGSYYMAPHYEKTGLSIYVTPGQEAVISMHFEEDPDYGDAGHLVCGILTLEMQAVLPGVGEIE